MLPRLYDLRSLVWNAFTSMGSVLNTKIIVERVPATTGRFVSIMHPPEYVAPFVVASIGKLEYHVMPKKGYSEGVFVWDGWEYSRG
jgi:hypothetical protein